MTKFDTLKCQNENTRNRASGDTKPWKQRRGRPRPSSSCFRLPDPLLRTHTERNDLRRLLRAPLFLIVQFPVAVYCIIDCARDFQFPLITVAATGKDLQASLKV